MASIAYHFLISVYFLFDAQMLKKKCFYTKFFWNKLTFALTHIFLLVNETMFFQHQCFLMEITKKLNTKHHKTCYDLDYDAVMKIITCERIRFRPCILECYIRVFSVKRHFFALPWNSTKQPQQLLKFCSPSSVFYRKIRHIRPWIQYIFSKYFKECICSPELGERSKKGGFHGTVTQRCNSAKVREDKTIKINACCVSIFCAVSWS